MTAVRNQSGFDNHFSTRHSFLGAVCLSSLPTFPLALVSLLVLKLGYKAHHPYVIRNRQPGDFHRPAPWSDILCGPSLRTASIHISIEKRDIHMLAPSYNGPKLL